LFEQNGFLFCEFAKLPQKFVANALAIWTITTIPVNNVAVLRIALCARPHPTLSLTRERKKRQRQRQKQRQLRFAIYAFCKTPHLSLRDIFPRKGEATRCDFEIIKLIDF
jgi:hypothetical protein